MDNVIEKAKEQLNKNSESLHIVRLPTPIKKEFKQFALDEFSDDYGMCFKFVWEEWKTLRQMFDTIIANHETRIADMENHLHGKANEPQFRRMVNGRMIRVGGNGTSNDGPGP